MQEYEISSLVVCRKSFNKYDLDSYHLATGDQKSQEF